MKPHVPCVVGETHPETAGVFIQVARTCEIIGDGLETTDCRLWFADQCGYMRKRRLKEVSECQLKGSYQEMNQQTAFVALQVLRNICGVELSKEAVATGFAHVCEMTGLRGRWEILSQSPLTICDTGHNGHGIKYVAEQLKHESVKIKSAKGKLHVVLGMVGDKDVDVVLSLLPEDAIYYFTQPTTSRALAAEDMLYRWKLVHPLHKNSRSFESVRLAVAAAQKEASSDDVIFIGGSNYVVGEVLEMYPKCPLKVAESLTNH
jgi:dihydrofolate synthase/folylpolyglutamate synthase